jgi:hypothetical protein
MGKKKNPTVIGWVQVVKKIPNLSISHEEGRDISEPKLVSKSILLNTALEYAGRGWPVIPLHWPLPDGKCSCSKQCDGPGKHPLIKNWTNLGTTDQDQIRKWWATWPRANIGVLAGEKSGLLILDIDLKDDGPDEIAKLEIIHGKLPDTVEAITGSGGRHVLFKYPKGKMVPNKARFHKGLDTRSSGGMFVAAPSIHASGKRYGWDAMFNPDETELAECPEWLLNLMTATKHGDKQGKSFEVPAVIHDGERNDTLFKMASSFRAKGFTEDEIMAMIEVANEKRCNPPLEHKELEKIVSSAAKYEPGEEFSDNRKSPEWPEPDTIREETLRPVQPILPALIPEAFRPWLTDISKRMQCPLDFVAVAAIVVSSALIGAGCGIRPKQRDDWTVIPNLWGGIIARPSMLKTPSLAEVMKPLGRLEVEAKEQFEDNLKYFEADIEIHKAQREALKSDMQAVAKGKKNATNKSMDILKGELVELEAPDTPIRKRYRTNDSTIEKLGELLNENPRGILVFRDELIGLLCSWDREDRAQDRAFYLEAWNGSGNFTTDRIGRGTLDVKSCCVSLLGGIQPAKLTGYLQQANSDFANDGLLQRFQLLVFPDEPKKWELMDEWPDKYAKEKAWAALKALTAIDFQEVGADLMEDDKIPFFRFSPEGQAIFNDWLTELEAKLRTEEMPLMVEHLAKYRSLMPSLSLIFHMLDIAEGKPGGSITEQAALMAAAWCEFLELHARRIYAIAGDTSIKATVNLAKKIKDQKVSDGFTIRDVYPKGWTLLDTKEKVDAACRELVEANWIKPDQVEIPGRQAKKVYRVNPKIFSLNA